MDLFPRVIRACGLDPCIDPGSTVRSNCETAFRARAFPHSRIFRPGFALVTSHAAAERDGQSYSFRPCHPYYCTGSSSRCSNRSARRPTMLTSPGTSGVTGRFKTSHLWSIQNQPVFCVLTVFALIMQSVFSGGVVHARLILLPAGGPGRGCDGPLHGTWGHGGVTHGHWKGRLPEVYGDLGGGEPTAVRWVWRAGRA